MSTIVKSGIAGLVGTIVLSILMVMKTKMGLMPELDIIAMLSSKMGGNPMMGWIGHFMIGIVGYGIAFTVLKDKLPGSYLIKGIIVGVLGWLMMMIVVMPMMGAGLFAMNMGMMAPVMTLVLHIIFGATLGLTYKMLSKA